MAEWDIEIVVYDINRKLRFTAAAADLCAAKQKVIQEFRKYSTLNKKLYLEATQRQGVYTIVSDMDDAGQAQLRLMSEC